MKTKHPYTSWKYLVNIIFIFDKVPNKYINYNECLKNFLASWVIYILWIYYFKNTYIAEESLGKKTNCRFKFWSQQVYLKEQYITLYLYDH